jgi:hypothetical protein
VAVPLCSFFQRCNSHPLFCVFRCCSLRGREPREFRPQVFETELFAQLGKPDKFADVILTAFPSRADTNWRNRVRETVERSLYGEARRAGFC